jgi:hypothetical protein
MLVCVEVIGLSGRAKVVVFGCCYCIAIGYVAVDSIGRDNLYFDLFIEVILGDASQSPRAHVVFPERKSSGSCF